jgi:hypothetical protein
VADAKTTETCRTCGGSGRQEDPHLWCNVCGGSGYTTREVNLKYGPKSDVSELGKVKRPGLLAPGLTEDKARVLLEVVIGLAMFQDQSASKYLRDTGSYALFDEPSAVKKCRAVLKDLGLYP